MEFANYKIGSRVRRTTNLPRIFDIDVVTIQNSTLKYHLIKVHPYCNSSWTKLLEYIEKKLFEK